MSDAIFCPRCDQLLLERALCPGCGWERPVAVAPGALDPDPLPLGAVLSGKPALFEGVIWYAAYPTSNQEAGTLISLHRNGTIVRRHELATIVPPPACPVAETLAGDGNLLFLGLRDYAFGPRRPSKPLLALEPHSGQTAWSLPTPSRELSAPVFQRGILYLSGTSPGAVYAVDPSLARFRWRTALDVDNRFRPAVAADALVVLAGSLIGERTLASLTLADGEERWQIPAPVGAGQPLALPDLVVVPGREALYAYHARDGHLLWLYQSARTTSRGVATAPLASVGHRLLLATGAADGYALDAVDLASGECCWHFHLPVRRRIKITPVLLGNTVMIATSSGHLLGLDLDSGEPLWQEKLPTGVAALPVALKECLLLPGSDGFLYRLAWQKAEQPPTEAPAILEARGDWVGAAVAYALADPPAFSRAGRCLLRADQPQRALALFEAVGDELGAADALAAQSQYDAALARLPPDALDRRARWLSRLDRHEELEAFIRPALQAARVENDWQRVRHLCRQLGDWRGEAAACLALAEAVPRRQIPVAASPASEIADGLPPELYRHLSIAFRASDTFQSQDRLRALFADGRLAPWRLRLRDARTIDERVQATIELLHDQYNRDGDNGLLLLVQLLAERQHPDDIWRDRLKTLSQELAQTLRQGTARHHEQVPLPEAYEWWFRAGQIFAAHNAWSKAEESFRKAHHYPRCAEALARQERWEEAGDLLRQQKVAFAQAAAYYWQAAQAALAGKPSWQTSAPRAAALFQKAQECFLFCGNLEGLLLCRTEADRALSRPRLLLGEGYLTRPLQQGLVSRFTLPLYNLGFGPAADIQVWAYGNALQRQRSAAQPVSDFQPIVVAGAETTLALTIEPRATAPEAVPLQIDLLIRYRDVDDRRWEEGPFAVHQPVLPATATTTIDASTAPIQPHHQGTYFDTAEKVRIIRMLRDTTPGPEPLDTLFHRLRQQLQED